MLSISRNHVLGFILLSRVLCLGQIDCSLSPFALTSATAPGRVMIRVSKVRTCGVHSPKAVITTPGPATCDLRPATHELLAT